MGGAEIAGRLFSSDRANTRFLIADEMTTMLDAVTQAQIWNVVMKIISERNMRLVVVSHEKNLIDRLCHRIVYI